MLYDNKLGPKPHSLAFLTLKRSSRVGKLLISGVPRAHVECPVLMPGGSHLHESSSSANLKQELEIQIQSSIFFSRNMSW